MTNTRSLVIMTSLLASTSLCAPALAQSAAFSPLSPMTPWAVTKVEASDDSGAYCALARRFAKNTIITLARNEAGEASLALDFQASKLTAGANMQVTLDPGSGEQRMYDIQPISDKAFVVRLGRDDKFFAALQNSGMLRINAAGGSYSFNLSDIEEGQSKLNSCLSTAGASQSAQSDVQAPTPQAADEAADASSNAPAPAVNAAAVSKDVHEALAGLRNDIQSLRQQNQRLTDLVSKSDNLRALNQPEAHDGVIVSELNRAARQLKAENQDLKDQASGISAGDVEPSATMLNDLQQRNAALQSALFSMKLRRGDVDHTGGKISAMVKNNASISAPSIEPAAGEARAEIFALRDENQRLQGLLAKKIQPIRVADAVPAAQVAQQSAPAPVQLTPPAPPQAVQAPMPTAPLVPPAPSLADVQKQLASLTAEAESLRARNKELEQKLLQNSGDKNTVDVLNQKVKSLTEDNARLEAQIKKATAGPTDATDKIAALTKENAELKKQIDDLKAAAKSAGLSSADHEELVSLRKENADLKQKLADADKGGEQVADLKAQLAEETKKADDLEAQLKEAQGKLSAANEAAASAEKHAEATPIKKHETAVKAAPVKKSKEPQQDVAQDVTAMAPDDKELKDAAPAPQEAPSMQNDGRSEAQKEEDRMREALKNPPAAAPEKPVEPAHASEDPYAPIAAQNDVKSFESVAGAKPEAKIEAAPVKEAASGIKAEPLAPPPGTRQASAQDTGSSDITWNKPADAKAAPAAIAAPAPAPAAAKGYYQPSFSVKDVLVKASIVPDGGVRMVEKVSGQNKVAYQWKSGDVYGSAEQTPMASDAQFDASVKDYLNKTQKRCAGDFAVAPDNSAQVGGSRVDSYEIACVGKGVNSSAALLFVEKAGSFTVVAHEAPTDKMADAMNIRDRLMKAIGGS